MKKAEVKVGEVYAVKVSDNMAPVVIDEEHPKGGWTGTNQETNRQVRVKTAQRLRCPWDDYLKHGDGDEEAGADTAPSGAVGASARRRLPAGLQDRLPGSAPMRLRPVQRRPHVRHSTTLPTPCRVKNPTHTRQRASTCQTHRSRPRICPSWHQSTPAKSRPVQKKIRIFCILPLTRGIHRV